MDAQTRQLSKLCAARAARHAEEVRRQVAAAEAAVRRSQRLLAFRPFPLDVLENR
jgi:hypothetical protein